MNFLRAYRDRVKGRPDSEHGQAVLRLVIVSLLLIVTAWIASHDPRAGARLWPINLFSAAFSVLLLACILRRPHASPRRRLVGALHDNLAITAWLYASGPTGALALFVYPFVTTGNGFRYGVPYLASSGVLGAFGIATLVLAAPAWVPHRDMGYGVLLSHVFVTLYTGALLRRLHRGAAETRLLQEKLFQAQKMESIGYLAAGVAHDFNNLLTVISGNAELALVGLPEEAPARPHLSQIEATTQRAAELTAKLLDYAGESPSTREPVDLSATTAEAADALQGRCSPRVLLRRELASDLPRTSADPSQLRQVVTHLLTNAAEAIGDEEGVITVRTGVAESEAYLAAGGSWSGPPGAGVHVFVEVADTGCGMDEPTRARVFDPFFTTKFTGRGLGLAAVLGIVRSHGGVVQVLSAPNEGATFRLLLPVGGGTPEGAEGGRGDGEARERGPDATLLVVDDEQEIRDVVQAALEQLGYRVLTAADGTAGVEAVRREGDAIGFVLLDLTMPRMGGGEAFREIRRLRPELPVVVASGYPEQEAAAHFAEARPTGFLQKPFRLDDLVGMIRGSGGSSPSPL